MNQTHPASFTNTLDQLGLAVNWPIGQSSQTFALRLRFAKALGSAQPSTCIHSLLGCEHELDRSAMDKPCCLLRLGLKTLVELLRNEVSRPAPCPVGICCCP